MELSTEDARELVEDRIKFKLYSAEHHLRNLKFLEQNEGDISSSLQLRVRWEMEIEPLIVPINRCKGCTISSN